MKRMSLAFWAGYLFAVPVWFIIGFGVCQWLIERQEAKRRVADMDARIAIRKAECAAALQAVDDYVAYSILERAGLLGGKEEPL
jgi:hypothetical protein